MSKGKRIPREKAEAIAARLIDQLQANSGLRCVIGGSIRREKETVGDIDIAVRCSSRRSQEQLNQQLGELFGWCSTRPDRAKRFGEFEGVQINVFDVLPQSMGAALLFCTGSGQFNIIMRCIAKRRGYLLNQYGLWERENRDERICKATQEKSIFEALGLEFVEPTDRTDTVLHWGM